MSRSVLSSQSAPGTPLAPARRGSTIIVAVGVLAVLALVAVSYTVVVRNERRSALAYSTGVDLEASGRVVRDEIGAILAADLFGNKIVTSVVPREGNFQGQRIRVWPRMFEDGEFVDVPQTAVGLFDTRDPDRQRFERPNPNDPWVLAPRLSAAFGPYFPSAPARDDAWLSNTEPYNPFGPLPTSPQNVRFNWTTWGQISNLRDPWRWVRDGQNDTVGLWVRGDGRFADLGQFFLTQAARDNESGDPGANLLYSQRRNGRDEFTNEPNGPRVGLSTTQGPGGIIPLATSVFGLQLHQLAEETTGAVGDPDAPQLTAFDRRFWADTDGDLRPDARWTVLDGLDGLLGLRWVVAARIIDNSALVNVNTAIEFQDPSPGTPNVGDGRTPADVDLYRLLSSAVFAPDLRSFGYWTPAPPGFTSIVVDANNRYTNLYRVNPRDSANAANHPYNQHLITQLGLDRFTEEYHGAQAIPLPTELTAVPGSEITFQAADTYFGPSSPNRSFTTRLQRYMHNREFGVSPLQPQTKLLTGYALSDEASLRTYHAVNYDAITSKIEQRLDHGVLDGSADPTIGMGPLRVLERSASARQFTLDPSLLDQDRPTVYAIASDTRRHLTTVNGVGDFSPVPVLNDASVNLVPVFGQPFNARVRLRDFPYESPSPPAVGASQPRTPAQRELHRTIERSFESFAWALAPLAGHRPLMAPLSDDQTGWALAQQPNPSRFFYGGDTNSNIGPARALSQQNGANGRDPGAAYALLRAASLAINAADATDFNAVDPDLPTVARLYNIPHPRPYEIDPFAAGDASRYSGLPARPIPDAVVRLGVGFSWGDLRDPSGAGADARVPAPNANLLPAEYVGEPLNGVTLVGLDRQPFLREIATVAIYADELAFIARPNASQLSAANERIDPDMRAERIGSIVAWEVGNPWTQTIDMRAYRLMLARGDAEWISFDWDPAVTSTIAPGGRVLFYAVHWDDGNLRHTEFVTSFVAQWRAELETRIDPDDLRLVTDGLAPGMIGSDLMLFDEPIPFWEWPSRTAVGLIALRAEDNETLAGAGNLVLDRLSPGSGGGVPSTLGSPYPLTPATVPATRRTGVVTMSGSVARHTESPSAGFPAWVIERPAVNLGDITAPGAILTDWSVNAGGPTGGFSADPAEVATTQSQQAVEIFTPLLALEEKGEFPIAVPSFQLFVPNTELRYLSELHQLSAFTHMYVHGAADDAGAIFGNNIASAQQAGPGTWRTVSEQLGSDAELYRNGANDSAGLNAYLGTLDPTRFVLASSDAPGNTLLGSLGPVQVTGGANPVGLPEALALPLALRVFDAFEPLATPSWRDASRLVQGRMNINTAAQKSLRMLPLVDPQDQIGSLRRQSETDTTDVRVPLIMSYRDRRDVNGAFITPAQITGLLGNNLQSPLRFVSGSAEPDLFHPGLPAGEHYGRGFASIGELAVLDTWDPSNPSNPSNPGSAQPRGFLELGADGVALGANDTPVPSLDIRKESFSNTDSIVRPTPYSGGNLDGFKGVDDAEDRLALFRAVSNIVTTRSDVFSAYFIVRGYSPGDIESIEVAQGNATDLQISGYLDALRPTYEGRYLAVFDRSTVRVPTDRPRVLLFVRLPD